MIPTFIGVGITLAAIWILVRGTVPAMMAMLIGCTIMSGGAALQLPALGGTSLPPFEFAIIFVLLKLATGEARFDAIRLGIALNLAFVVYVAYGIVMAWVGPHMFHDAMLVIPMRPTEMMDRLGLPPVPLQPTTQNITSAVYITGTLVLTICSSAAVLHRNGTAMLVKTAVVVAWIQVFLGVTGALFNHTPWGEFLDLFRNGSYAMLDQSMGSFTRIKGIAPEPSAFAGSNFVWFVFLSECWLRGALPRRTGPAAAAIGLTLLFSTSSTAYLGLGAYFAMFLLRAVLVPTAAPFHRTLTVVAAMIGGCLLVGLLEVVTPSLAQTFIGMLADVTIHKGASASGIERAAIAHQGITAFLTSHGIGVGPGSFRSSSFASAVLGTTGVVGALAFGIYLMQVFKPLRPSTYVRSEDPDVAAGVAASWAALIMMVPASLVSPSGDPGPEFAILAGAAIALRWRAARRAEEDAPPVVPMRRNLRPAGPLPTPTLAGS